MSTKTAICKVEVNADDQTELDKRLTRLIDNFPSVKGAVSLIVFSNADSVALPTDPVLDHFGRLETIAIFTRVGDKDPSFWSDLFATKTFRRMRTFLSKNVVRPYRYPVVDVGALFAFITDFLRMPANKPRVVQFNGCFDADFLDALEHRFNQNIDSIGGHVCAVMKNLERNESRYLTNMAVGSQKEILAEQLLRDA